jgi:hypothetical protein
MFIFAIGLFPWLIILGASILIMAALELSEESGLGASTASLIVGTGLVLWLTHSNPLPWLAAHLGILALGVVGYFIAGIAWGFFKWYVFNIDIRDRYKAANARMDSRDIPSASNHKARIIGWMTYWPWNATWFVLNDPIRRAWNAIYSRAVAKLEAVTAHVFKNVQVK